MKVLKALVFFITIALAVLISERGLIYYVMLSTSDRGYKNPYPLSELSPYVRYGVSAALVMVSLWITYKAMQCLSFIKTKMINKTS